jgi:hypothetical protein
VRVRSSKISGGELVGSGNCRSGLDLGALEKQNKKTPKQQRQ